MKKYIAASAVLFFGLVGIASAHVIVSPHEAGIGEFETFTVGVPTERDVPTVGLKLVMPEGLDEVVPDTKQGWSIDVKKEGQDEDAGVTEIDWTGGSIPPGQRDEFSFSAQVPSSPGTLIWKAYQTYQDGTVVSWDEDPTIIPSGEEGTPYSTTVINDDLHASSTPNTSSGSDFLDIAALAISLIALVVSFRSHR